MNLLNQSKIRVRSSRFRSYLFLSCFNSENIVCNHDRREQSKLQMPLYEGMRLGLSMYGTMPNFYGVL